MFMDMALYKLIVFLLQCKGTAISLYHFHQVDVFEIEAVSLGEVTQCIVSHDGDGIGEGWYLDEILVRDGPDASHEYVFPCCRSVPIHIYRNYLPIYWV